MVQGNEGDDLGSILAVSGPAGIDAWVQSRLASHPQEEAITLKRAFKALRRDHPDDAIAYGERLLLKRPRASVLERLSTVYEKIGNLTRARELAEMLDRPTPDWAARTARLTSQLRLLQRGYPLPERTSTPRYDPVPRRVMYLLHDSQPHSSAGYAIRSQGLAKAIRRLGYDLCCVTRLGYPWDDAGFDSNMRVDTIEHVDGVPYIRLPSMLAGRRTIPLEDYFKLWADRLCALAEMLKPSVIHAASNFMCGTVANLVARRLGLPSIYEVRGLSEINMISRHPKLTDTDLHRMYVRMETEAAGNASAVFAITDAVKAELVRRGVPQDKIALLPNGVDVSRWKRDARDRDLERSLGLTGKTVIGYVGSTGTHEGLDLLLHAAHRLRQRSHNRFAVLIVGDGRALQGLKQLTEQLQLSDIVRLIGRVPHSEVDPYYSLIDITPYPRKGLQICEMVSPLKPFEAMCMGKAVICSDVAVLAEIVSHETTGLLHRKDDVESLTTCLHRLLDSSELRSRLGSQAREWVRANRDWQTLAKVVCETYDAL